MILDFFKDNILLIFIPVLFAAAMFIKPFRRFIAYCAKNITVLIFFIFISVICSFFGYTAISFNVISAASALLLGLPGISLALFLALVI